MSDICADIGAFLGGKQKEDTIDIVYLKQKVQQLLAHHAGEDIPFNPVDLTLGTKTWLDASDSDAVLADLDGKVHTFLDKFGNNHLYQNTPANQPTTGTTTKNGLNTIKFEDPDFLGSERSGIRNENQVWLFVFKPDVVDAGSDSLFTYGDQWKDGNWQLMSGDSSQFHGSLWKDAFPASPSHKFGNTDLNGSWTLFSVEFDRQMGTISGWVNGVPAFQNIESAPALNEFQPIKLFQSRASQESPSGEVAEVIITPTVEDSSRELLEWYLTDKWDLTALPSSHPYATTPPSGGSGGGTQVWQNSTETRPRSGASPFSITLFTAQGSPQPTTHPYVGNYVDTGEVTTLSTGDQFPIYKHEKYTFFIYKEQITVSDMVYPVWVFDQNYHSGSYLFRSSADVDYTNVLPGNANWTGDHIPTFGPGGDFHYTDAQHDLLDFTQDANGDQITGTLVSNVTNTVWTNNFETYNFGPDQSVQFAIGEANGVTQLNGGTSQFASIDRESFTGKGLRILSIEFDSQNTSAPAQSTRGTLYGVYNHTTNEIYYRALEFPDVYFPMKMTFNKIPLGRQT